MAVLLLAFETIFLLLGCLVKPSYETFCLVLVHFALLILAVGGLLLFWRPALFCRESCRGMGLEEMGGTVKLEGVEAEETVVVGM